jgi:hypothetical protein
VPASAKKRKSSFFKAVFFALVKEVRFGGTEIDNFGTAFAALFQLTAFTTVVRVRDTGVAANHTPSLQTPVIALVTNVHEHGRIDKRRTNHANTITCAE